MKRNVKIVLAGLLLSLAIAGITLLLQEGERRELKNLVITYNNMLLKAHMELKSDYMQRLTSPTEFSKIDNYLAYLLKNRRTMRGEIREIKFDDIKVSGGQAMVLTREHWSYYYVDPGTEQPVSEVYEVVYGNTYHLKKQSGHWVVDNLESKEILGKTEG